MYSVCPAVDQFPWEGGVVIRWDWRRVADMHEFSLLFSPNFCREQAGQDVLLLFGGRIRLDDQSSCCSREAASTQKTRRTNCRNPCREEGSLTCWMTCCVQAAVWACCSRRVKSWRPGVMKTPASAVPTASR